MDAFLCSHYTKIAGISGIGKNKAPVTVLNNLFLLISKSLQTLQRFGEVVWAAYLCTKLKGL